MSKKLTQMNPSKIEIYLQLVAKDNCQIVIKTQHDINSQLQKWHKNFWISTLFFSSKRLFYSSFVLSLVIVRLKCIANSQTIARHRLRPSSMRCVRCLGITSNHFQKLRKLFKARLKNSQSQHSSKIHQLIKVSENRMKRKMIALVAVLVTEV